MLPEDQKRLEREADIARAVRGPDYHQLLESISRNKADFQKRKQAQAETDARAHLRPVHPFVGSDNSVTLRLEASRNRITVRVHRLRRSGPNM